MISMAIGVRLNLTGELHMRQQKHISLVISLLGALIMPAAGCSSRISVQKFEPTWESLEQYECPAWFRDAKLGIFMHRGPCSVPGVDGWYGQNMYIEGSRHYKRKQESL